MVVVVVVVVVVGGCVNGVRGGRREQHLRKCRGGHSTRQLSGLALLLVELEVLECGEKSLHVSLVFEERVLTSALDIAFERPPQYTNLVFGLFQSLL